MGRYGEIWGDMGEINEAVRDAGDRLRRYEEIWGDMGRYGEIWGRYGGDQ